MHVTSLLRFTLVAMISCAGALARADVLVVDASGAGAFTQISVAVAAAADGDVLLVKSGSYAGFTITNKALDVVADAGANVQVQGGVVVIALSATRAVTLAGLTLHTPVPAVQALRVVANSGSVRVQGCTVRGYQPVDCVDELIDGGTAVVVSSSVDVAFANCTLDGGRAALYDGNYGDAGGAGLASDLSSVALYDCTLRAGAGGSFSLTCGTCCGGYAGHGGSGIRATRTTLFSSNTTARGGDAGAVSPGVGSNGCPGFGLSAPATVPATNVSALQSTFTHGTAVSVCGTPIVDVSVPPPGTFAQLAGVARRMSATRVARELQPVRMDFFGQPGDRVQLIVADAPRFVYSATWRGVSLVRRPHPSPVLQVGTVPASGRLSYAWIVSELGPGVESRRFFLQAEFVDASGQKTLSTPSTLVLVDAAF